MKRVTLGAVLAFAAIAAAQAFDIEREVDPLTQATILRSDSLKVCMAKGLQCAALQFAWDEKQPADVGVRVELPGQLASVVMLQMRIDDQVETFYSTHGTTEFDSGHDGFAATREITYWTSANTFVLPARALVALAEQEPGLLRICGARNDCVDYDFRKRAKMRGLPVDELRQVIAALGSQETPPN